jgi:pyridoxamine 5'-phosphate oxidase
LLLATERALRCVVRDTSSRIGDWSRKDVDVNPSTSHPISQLPDMRREYAGELTEADLAPDWHTQFGRWFAEAVTAGQAGELPEPNAMVLATADALGWPSVRTVLLKGFDERGFTFFTNLTSRKGQEALANPHASVVFPWYVLHRQVIVRGAVRPVGRDETEVYFATRPRGSQLGAWASPQSSVIGSREELETAWSEAERRFPDGAPVPLPPHWGGFRVVPDSVEFWQGRPSRLHDRLRFRRADSHDESGWLVERLAP